MGPRERTGWARTLVALVASVLVGTGLFGISRPGFGPSPVDAAGPAISGATNYNSQRKVAVAPDGGPVAVTYVQVRDGVTTVLAKVSEDGGVSWEHLPPLSRLAAFRPALAYDSAAHLHVAWTELDGDHRQVFYARWRDDGGWHDRIRLSDTPGYSGYPSLGVDALGRVHVVWYGFDGSQYQVYYRFRGPDGHWSDTEQATRWVRDANAPAIAVSHDNRVHVAFFTFVEGVHDVQYMVRGPDGWSPPERVNPEGHSAAQPSLVVHGDGTPAVAYGIGEGGESGVVYSERRGSRWTDPVTLSAEGRPAGRPSLAALPEHGALVAWDEEDRGVWTAAVLGGRDSARRLTAGAWDRSVQIAESGARWPSLSWAAYPAVAWSQPVYAAWTHDQSDGARVAVGELSKDGRLVARPSERTLGSRVDSLTGALLLGGFVVIAGLALIARRRSIHH